MRTTELHPADTHQRKRALVAWILATFIVAFAVAGPPLAGPSVPALVQLRHQVLMIDNELERWSLLTAASRAGTSFTQPRLICAAADRSKIAIRERSS
jgi:hypothetical protein